MFHHWIQDCDGKRAPNRGVQTDNLQELFPCTDWGRACHARPQNDARLAECRFVQLDLSVPTQIVRDLLPGSSRGVERLLRCHLSRERSRQFCLCGDVVLENARDARLDSSVWMIV